MPLSVSIRYRNRPGADPASAPTVDWPRGLGIPEDSLEPYGHYKAKVSLDFIDSLKRPARTAS